MLCVKMVELPVHPETFEMDAAATRAAVNPNTIMIFSSAPNYPNGVIDPITLLSAIAKEADIGLHVDCCLGGFFLPFARQLRANVPAFDFALPGVTAMSCDTHKYGYAAKGTSVVLYRDAELRNFQVRSDAVWSALTCSLLECILILFLCISQRPVLHLPRLDGRHVHHADDCGQPPRRAVGGGLDVDDAAGPRRVP